jgi:uncharacterized membrane protein
MVYGVNLLLCAVAYYVLQTMVIRADGKDSPLADALGADRKGRASPFIYLAGILGCLLSPWIGIAAYVTVAVIWLVPDTRVERYLASHPGLAQSAD